MKPIVCNGQTYTIDHLAPMNIECPCEEVGRPLVIGVDFANHCYTEAYVEGAHTKEQILLYEAADRARVFSPDRHGLSFRLPDVVRALPGARVHQTAEVRNYVYVVPLEVNTRTYEVYFMIQRAEADPKLDLRVTIESAYSPPVPTILPKKPRTIRFKILAYKTLKRDPIKFAAR
ncbi:MAG: hypothetical protein WD871_00630 [Xanthobacteraceae bacterium]